MEIVEELNDKTGSKTKSKIHLRSTLLEGFETFLVPGIDKHFI